MIHKVITNPTECAYRREDIPPIGKIDKTPDLSCRVCKEDS